MAHITLNQGENEWAELLIDGKYITSDHTIDQEAFMKVLRLLGHTIEYNYGKFVDETFVKSEEIILRDGF